MCRVKKKLRSISLNVDASIETVRAEIAQLRDGKPIDRLMAADAFELFINAVEKQNNRLRETIK